MLILLSPAKTLDYETPAKVTQSTQPDFIEQSTQLIEVCRQLTPAEIASLMKVSDKIAGLNAARFAQWQPEVTTENGKQAVYAFRGDVYTGLDVDSWSDTTVKQAQAHLRILSGLYGLLKPLDLMQAYRLEMGTKLAIGAATNLYQFWGDQITTAINEALKSQGDENILNLASNEYFKAVNKKQVTGNIISPVFKDFKNGQYKVISFYAKKARGLMARYVLEKNISNLADLQKFDIAGYRYSNVDSTPQAPVFLRDEQ